MAKAFGQNTAESWLEIQITDLSEFAGCKGKIPPRQITEMAQIIIEEYPHFNMAEFMLFFQRFKRGYYGRFYGNVDPMIIVIALRDFSHERTRERIQCLEMREKAEEARRDREVKELRRHYAERVPDAFTDKAALSFLQYRLMGYDCKSDEELQKDIADILSGVKVFHKDVIRLLNSIGADAPAADTVAAEPASAAESAPVEPEVVEPEVVEPEVVEAEVVEAEVVEPEVVEAEVVEPEVVEAEVVEPEVVEPEVFLPVVVMPVAVGK